jgi:hypothetical protein
MKSKVKTHKKQQRLKTFELEPDEWVEVKTEAPKKRASIRKYYPMKVVHNSLEDEDYLELAPQLQGLEPSKFRMTILTSEGSDDWDLDDDEI